MNTTEVSVRGEMVRDETTTTTIDVEKDDDADEGHHAEGRARVHGRDDAEDVQEAIGADSTLVPRKVSTVLITGRLGYGVNGGVNGGVGR